VAGHHPGMKYYCICLVCFGKEIQKKMKCSKLYMPTTLINHLWQLHKEQYEEYLMLDNEIKKKGKGTASANIKLTTELFCL
jgi:hypothetical protein